MRRPADPPGSAGRRDERGVIMILGAMTATVIILAASFAIDLGGRSVQKRRDHLVADLAALDATRGVAVSAAAVNTIASQSAARNGFGSNGDTLTVVRGHWDPTQVPGERFKPETEVRGLPQPSPCPCDSVWVDAASGYNDFFRAAGATLDASAVAQPQNEGAFAIGSSLADINSGLAGFGAVSLTAVGYTGLATGNVTIATLAGALGINTAILSPDQVLDSQFTVARLVNASASLLSASNPTAAADLTALGSALSVTAANSTGVTLRRIFGIGAGAQSGSGSVLSTTVHLQRALTGAIDVVNQQNGVLVGADSSQPGIASNFSAAAIVPPTEVPLGPAYPNSGYATGTNSQVTVNLTMAFTNALGVGIGTLTFSVVVGGSTGTLKAVDCPNNVPTDLVIGTTFTNMALTVTGGTILGVPITGAITVPSSAPDTTVYDAANWLPPGTTPATAHGSLGTPTFGLAPAGAALTTLLSILTGPAVSATMTTIDQFLATKGVTVGNADYFGTNLLCGVPKLLQ